MSKRRAKFTGKRFTSGQLRLNVNFDDSKDAYRVRLCPTVPGERCETVTVGAIPSGFSRRTGKFEGGPKSRHGKRLAYDDPRAMREAASSAISHSDRDMQQYAAYNRRGSGYLIKPAVRRRRAR